MKITLGLSGERVVPSLTSALAGVGIIRGEYVFRRLRSYVTIPAASRWLTEYLEHVAMAFAPAAVWYRTADLEAREISVLAGSDLDVVDPVAMLGTRGVRRAMLQPATFDLELMAFARAARAHPNLGLAFPYVAEPTELAWVIDRARSHGITAPLGCMAEIPAAVLAIEDLLDCGITRVIVGCNDLGSLTMGVERGSVRYARVSSGLARMIDRTREATAARGVELALAGYLTEEHLRYAAAHDVDECVVHYADLPNLVGPQYADLPELGLMTETKQWTRRALSQSSAGSHESAQDTCDGDAAVDGTHRPERRRWPRPRP